MHISSIGAYQSVSCRADIRPKAVTKEEKAIIDKAKIELERIEAQGKKAGTDAAWWRAGFDEAKAVLENIVSGKEEPVRPANNSGLMSFHDFDDDGLI